MSLNCNRLHLSDEEMSRILNSFISNSRNFSLLHRLSASLNNFTKIPLEIRLFPSPAVLDFSGNEIASIKADDFNFSSLAIGDEDRILLYLDNNLINYIEPGAFVGKYTPILFSIIFNLWIMMISLFYIFTKPKLRNVIFWFVHLGGYFEESGSSLVDLGGNKLTRFESSVFRLFFEKNYILSTIFMTNSNNYSFITTICKLLTQFILQFSHPSVFV